MSGVATAIVATSILTTAYQAEQARQAQSDSDEKIKQEKIAAGVERDWQNKKKGMTDKNAANAALRLRGGTEAGLLPNTATGQQPIPGTVGVLGGTGNTPLNANSGYSALGI